MPGLRAPSRRVHSRYERRLLDAAIAGRETVLHLRVRRFFCTTAGCERKVFVEQVDGVTTRGAKIITVARGLLERVALALGGRAGARLAARLGLGAGRMTLLRAIRALPLPAIPALTAVGVDDFALRRGHRYGTVLVDMTTHQVVDVLDDRTAGTLAAWLSEHPGIEVICRDRAGAFADAAATGAPTALQVADRWHLMHNLSDAVYQAVAGHRRCLQPSLSEPEPATPIVTTPGPGDTPIARRTRIRHAEIHTLIGQGHGIYATASRLGLDPKTVRWYAEATDPEQLISDRGTSRDNIIDTYKPYLLQRCTDGLTGTNQLLAEIRTQGYTGSERTLRRCLISVRGSNAAVAPPPPIPKAREITGRIMRPTSKLTSEDQEQLQRLCELCPDLSTIRDLAHGFTDLLRTRGGDRLEAWVTRAEQESIPQIRSFANGLRRDRTAVTAGLTTSWSSGPVEGAVNRIKMLKRQMYGRANTDLLRHRIILAD
ncbi:ISL3 family transposase [Actinoplanes lobatus]|uniref:Transposase n=1 Tax=Actinoplanes lobatus TaxID=113568 RepID=A0A7W7HL60_9ACTN|nr:ISL3 family transposase [Actinoplanes lobatus]MBB4752516.1 transposase [Actinoplanes lobatus]GGN94039.1 ISL3 family transposase [Actinoplanes lobatus]GIE44816.1 ISL3 family transposase [Actinoplanes lobatus]